MGRSHYRAITQHDPAEAAGGLMPILMIALLFGVMYFMMIRPQQKRRREAEADAVRTRPGRRGVTIGGLYGTVDGVEDETVLLEVGARRADPLRPRRPSRGWSPARRARRPRTTSPSPRKPNRQGVSDRCARPGAGGP